MFHQAGCRLAASGNPHCFLANASGRIGVCEQEELPLPKGSEFQIGLLKRSEIAEADRMFHLAFGTFLGMPDPMQFMGDRELVRSRTRAKNVRAFAARHGERLVGSCIATRWGSFGFFGPLTVLPEYWDRGVARRLLERTVTQFANWGLCQTGLLTFAASPKHVGLYQSFGYWPRSLTAIMTRAADSKPACGPDLLSRLGRKDREAMIVAAARLTSRIGEGLDLTEEIRSTLVQRTGDVVLDRRRGILNGFAICLTGTGSEGGAKTCYVKFGAARRGCSTDARPMPLLGKSLSKQELTWRAKGPSVSCRNADTEWLRSELPCCGQIGRASTGRIAG